MRTVAQSIRDIPIRDGSPSLSRAGRAITAMIGSEHGVTNARPTSHPHHRGAPNQTARDGAPQRRQPSDECASGSRVVGCGTQPRLSAYMTSSIRPVASYRAYRRER